MRSIDPDITGKAVHSLESARLLKEGYINGGLYALIAIVIYIFLIFRSLTVTVLVLIPVGFGFAWTVGILNLFDISLNLANLVILPLIIGIGVVDGVHILHRFHEGRERDTRVLSKSTGQGVVLSSLTTMMGFGSLMVADHQGVYSIGLVLTIGVGCCLVASITILPALLKLLSAKGWHV